MKKVLLAIIAFAAIVASDISAGCWRNRCNPCAVRTECAPVCAPRCEPRCETAPTYKVVEETCPQVPRCVKYVPVEGTPICYRTCRWACPAGFELAGTKEAHKFELDASEANRNY